MSSEAQRLTLEELHAGDSAALNAFYRVYQAAFPDRNERESLENMARCLRSRNRSGKEQHNNYHILVASLAGRIVGGAVSNYFSRPNAGVIEFLFVSSDVRKQRLGRRILKQTEAMLGADASRIGKRLRAILAEMNDPFRTTSVPDNMDPLARSIVWGKWGFSRLDFQYVQPALDSSKSPVLCLCLIGKVMNSSPANALPSHWIAESICEYMRWAMRIPRPRATVEFARMRQELTRVKEVRLTPLQTYVGHDPKRVLLQKEVIARESRNVSQLSKLLNCEIPACHALDVDELHRALELNQRNCQYHLWAVRRQAGSRAEGLASFFSLPSVGFGGYIVLAGALRGKGLLGQLLARIEMQILRDNQQSQGWFVECFPSSLPAFLRKGFLHIPVEYHVPRLPGQPETTSSRLYLMFKPFGLPTHTVALSGELLRRSFAEILRFVYGVQSPKRHRHFRRFVATLRVDAHDQVELVKSLD